jgi:hypothetical protein
VDFRSFSSARPALGFTITILLWVLFSRYCSINCSNKGSVRAFLIRFKWYPQNAGALWVCTMQPAVHTLNPIYQAFGSASKIRFPQLEFPIVDGCFHQLFIDSFFNKLSQGAVYYFKKGFSSFSLASLTMMLKDGCSK